MHHVYILINEYGRTYVGYTQNIERRLFEHNNIASSGWSHGKGPWKLLHAEEYSTKSEAMKREKWYKTGIGRKQITSMKSAGVSALAEEAGKALCLRHGE